jgi:molybdenum cofactor biosynthesis protein B
VSAEEAPHVEHKRQSPRVVSCVVLTVSDSRTPETDASGRLIEERLLGAGHKVLERRIVPDEPEAVRTFLRGAIERGEVDAAIVTGGSGVAPRDKTPEAVEPLLDRTLPGFGELFRVLSYEEVGAAAMLSRAVAGTAGRTVLFVLPGSRKAVELAMDRLILPELPHIVGQLSR